MTGLYAPGPPLVDSTELRALLAAHDDPEYPERPADYDDSSEQRRLDELVAALDYAFACRCEVDRQVQDAAFHGEVVVPQRATRSGQLLVVRLSNFGRMAACSVGSPGAYDQAETEALVAAPDAQRIRAALLATGYRLVPDDPLWVPYDGVSAVDALRRPWPTWFSRYFDYV